MAEKLPHTRGIVHQSESTRISFYATPSRNRISISAPDSRLSDVISFPDDNPTGNSRPLPPAHTRQQIKAQDGYDA
ncbi:hypothetical protein N7530_010413 [Penicillium desertorum]|uniref:Uncharacterized protein n=1 Tax=Penicillium desertorum TaxID=1303715 RepID=A0A9W9WHC7_9EURO|nr:hypothetical protein N7530_010413 [Penicillium desertorum]